jgi:hypothetical protein
LLPIGLAESAVAACRLAERTCEQRASIFWLTRPAIAMDGLVRIPACYTPAAIGWRRL